MLYSNNIMYTISEHLSKNSDTILPEVVLKNNGQKLVPNYYEKGFDFNYDKLLELELSSQDGILIFNIPDDRVN